jgi:hypothetical protein
LSKFVVGLAVPGLGRDPSAVGQLVRGLCVASGRGHIGLRITRISLGLGDLRVEMEDVSPGPEQEFGRRVLAERLAVVVRAEYGASTVLPVGDWAFGSDKQELTAAQRAKVREEVLAMLPGCAPHEQELVRRIADALGKKR